MIDPFVPQDCTLADLGCGSGALITFFKAKISRAYGIDLSLPQCNTPDFEFKIGNLNQAIPLPDACLDVATALALLEHLEDAEQFVKEVHRILKPGGVCVATTPSPMAKPVLEFLAYRLKIISIRDIEDHKTYFEDRTLKDLFRAFSSVRVTTFQLGLNQLIVAQK